MRIVFSAKWTKVFLWTIGGVLLFGSLLGALSNAISLISPAGTYIATVFALLAYLLCSLFARIKGFYYSTSDGKTIIIKGLGPKIHAFLAGFILLLWLPRIIPKSDSMDDNKILPKIESTSKARISFVEKKLTLPATDGQPLRISFGLINYGNDDAVVTLKDATYYLSVDPTQKLFKYQSHPPMEFPVPAIPNAVWHGELRFPSHSRMEKC